MPDEKRRRIAQETLDIYAPLAGRIGMQEHAGGARGSRVRRARSGGPQLHRHGVLRGSRRKTADRIGRIAEQINEEARRHGIEAESTAARKRAYSIWRKLKGKQLNFEQLSDIFGFRVIVKTSDDCYHALGIVHTTWRMVPERFKDFISNPKPNGYRSIHTTVIGPAASASKCRSAPRTCTKSPNAASPPMRSMRTALVPRRRCLARESKRLCMACAGRWSCSRRVPTRREFLEHTKLELFHDQVFCFTPKGKLIACRARATAIDFAYAVHTDVGNMAVGCKINGKIAAARLGAR